MTHPLLLVEPRFRPPLDPEFRPAVLGNRAFLAAVRASGQAAPLAIALERAEGAIAVHRTEVFRPGSERAEANFDFAERLVKMLLWQYGGFRVAIGGPSEIGERIQRAYAPGGARAFDAELMAEVYGREFEVEVTTADRVPEAREPELHPRGRHFAGCRVGFDAGASDHKVAAVVDGEVVFSDEVPWLPAKEPDPEYHYRAISGAIRKAAARMPRLDGIGVSAAGVYIANQVRVASLFRAVPKDVFRRRVRTLFLDIQKEFGGVPLEVANDGEVAALAGSIEIGEGRVLGIALGSSEAGGYVTGEGTITSWLNELAFPAVDFQPKAPVDEWSGDRGCGGEYFSQKAVIRLAAKAGIRLDPQATPAQQLARVQGLLKEGDETARQIFETVGAYLGYGIAHYADRYDVRHVMLMGRVVSGGGGTIILRVAREVLAGDFPEIAERISIHLPDETQRRVGQAVAAASLPWIG